MSDLNRQTSQGALCKNNLSFHDSRHLLNYSLNSLLILFTLSLNLLTLRLRTFSMSWSPTTYSSNIPKVKNNRHQYSFVLSGVLPTYPANNCLLRHRSDTIPRHISAYLRTIYIDVALHRKTLASCYCNANRHPRRNPPSPMSSAHHCILIRIIGYTPQHAKPYHIAKNVYETTCFRNLSPCIVYIGLLPYCRTTTILYCTCLSNICTFLFTPQDKYTNHSFCDSTNNVFICCSHSSKYHWYVLIGRLVAQPGMKTTAHMCLMKQFSLSENPLRTDQKERSVT